MFWTPVSPQIVLDQDEYCVDCERIPKADEPNWVGGCGRPPFFCPDCFKNLMKKAISKKMVT